MKLKQIRVDGYKNLIDCEVNLGDFNVLVGPNNSGKSNLLEVMQLFAPILATKLEEIRTSKESIERGLSFSKCHLKSYLNRPLKIGVSFEMEIQQENWMVDYEVVVQFSKNEDLEFLKESLKAKEPSKRGPIKKYIERTSTKLKVAGKSHPISKHNSSLLTLQALYPDSKALPAELIKFMIAVMLVGFTKIYAISPDGMRNKVDKEKESSVFLGRTTSFDPLLVIDEIKEQTKYYSLFQETLCDILDLEDVNFEAKDIGSPSKTQKEAKKKRIRRFMIKRQGSDYADLEEFSDGTFVVVAILSSVFSPKFANSILCIEELENCLHPAAIEKLLRFLQDNADKWPVLITTHSPYVLNGVNPEDVNVAVVNETGATHFEKIKNTRELRDYLNKGLMSFGDLLVDNYKRFRE